MKSAVPEQRISTLVDQPPAGDYVLYWMTGYRRLRSNFALQRAADWSRHLGLPLVVFAALRCDYPWASDRIHAFAIDGISDVAAGCAGRVACVAYLEPEPGASKGLLKRLTTDAAVMVGDDAPIFFLPAARQAAASQSQCRFEVVDHNGLVPMAITDRDFRRAVDLRRFNQQVLPDHLDDLPDSDPLAGLNGAMPAGIASVMADYPSAPVRRDIVADLPIDHSVGATPLVGGEQAAQARLAEFVISGLLRYDERNQPDAQAESGLSPFLHFGQLSVHDVFLAVTQAEDWSPTELSPSARGGRGGWWGLSEQAEGFLDQVVTWRDIGYRAAYRDSAYDQYDALPEWARRTLEEHATDPRDYVYSLDEFASAETHDEVWNAAQRQLVETGTIHNYLRMLWGKKILEWTQHPRVAHDVMFELNNRYALDGRDPNSVSGIHWVLGRFDRAWGPERDIFGKVRYMTSQSALRKLRLKRYLSMYGANRPLQLD